VVLHLSSWQLILSRVARAANKFLADVFLFFSRVMHNGRENLTVASEECLWNILCFNPIIIKIHDYRIRHSVSKVHTQALSRRAE
jgi:hypothetical protein